MSDEDMIQTLTSRMGTGGGNVPMMLCITNQDEPAVAFTQNQRDEVRDLGDKAGCLSSQPGMKQQTYVLCIRERCGCEGGG